ncbi:KUP/HAK/KT family potassium transporter, partial [Klebsiella pneumoniae]|nr:KUP/HAK/KT family potassium transporter [Klebsiella pneumoniae]
GADIYDSSSMSADASESSSPAPGNHGHGQEGTGKLMLGALGVVFGDIGTSPLYALRETFAGHHPLPVDTPHIFGIISLVFWTMMLIVTLKYV